MQSTRTWQAACACRLEWHRLVHLWPHAITASHGSVHPPSGACFSNSAGAAISRARPCRSHCPGNPGSTGMLSSTFSHVPGRTPAPTDPCRGFPCELEDASSVGYSINASFTSMRSVEFSEQPLRRPSGGPLSARLPRLPRRQLGLPTRMRPSRARERSTLMRCGSFRKPILPLQLLRVREAMMMRASSPWKLSIVDTLTAAPLVSCCPVSCRHTCARTLTLGLRVSGYAVYININNMFTRCEVPHGSTHGSTRVCIRHGT